MIEVLVAVAVFIAVSLTAGVIAWLARPRPTSLFVEFGEVPRRQGSSPAAAPRGLGTSPILLSVCRVADGCSSAAPTTIPPNSPSTTRASDGQEASEDETGRA
jgi:hypothetical protein